MVPYLITLVTLVLQKLIINHLFFSCVSNAICTGDVSSDPIMKLGCYDLNDVDRNVEKICCKNDTRIVEQKKTTCESLVEHDYK